MQDFAVKISTAVGVEPDLISETLAAPNFSIKQASCVGVIDDGDGRFAGFTPTASRAFFCVSERPELVLLFVHEFVTD